MNIKYNNSLYCEIPPETIVEETTPNEMFEDTVAQHIEEKKYFYNYLDIEEERNRELIRNGHN